MEYCIYKHTNTVNGKVYIGKTCQDPETRFGSNGCGYRECPYFYKAIKKYGWDKFTHEVLYSGLTLSEANALEIETIQQYDSTNRDKGYNIRSGGDGFDSASSKELWSNQEYAKHIVDVNREKWADPNYKKQQSQKMLEAWKDPEKRKRRSASATKRWANEEFHAKTQAAVREACKTSVRCVETQEIFDSVVEACEKYNIHHSNLLRSVRKGCRSGGVHWEKLAS